VTSIQIDINDGLSSSTAIKGPVLCATTANITLVGEQTIDGVAVVTGNRVLVKNQTTASDNGIWICDTGNWRRSKDFNKAKDVKTGTMVNVTGGSAGAGQWQISTANPITIGTTSIAFTQVVQPYDADLAAIAALATQPYGRSLLTLASSTALSGELAAFYQPLDTDLTSWAGVTRAAGFDTFTATPSSANLLALLTTKTGTGNAVFSTSAILTTPDIGTATGTNLTLSAMTASLPVFTNGSKTLVTVANATAFDTLSPTTTRGDLIFRNATTNARLAASTAGYLLQTNGAGTDPTWSGFLQTGTSAVTRTWQDKLTDWRSVKDFGAVGNGSTDDTTAIQACITAVGVTGGTVWFPKGTYKISSALNVTAGNTCLQGEGYGGSILTTNSTTADMIVVGTGTVSSVANVAVRDLAFRTSVTRADGAAVAMNGCYVGEVTGCNTSGMFRGITVKGTSKIIFLERNYIASPVPSTGIGIYLTGNSNDIYMTNNFVIGDVATQPSAGIVIDNASGVWGYNTDTFQTNNGLYISPGNGQLVENCFFLKCAYDSGTGNGLTIAPSGTGAARRIQFTSCWSGTNAAHGVNIVGAAGTIDDVQFLAYRAYVNGQYGILCSGSNAINIALSECIASGNSSSSSGTYHGIAFGTGSSKFWVRNCRSGPIGNMSNTQGYGLIMTDSATNNVMIVGNDFTGNVTGAVSSAVLLGNTKVMHTNLGVARVAPNMQVAAVKGTKTALSNSITTAQAIFAAANDTLTLDASSTYRFRAKIGLNTGATSHTTAFSLGGTATFTSISYVANTTSSAAATLATPQMIRVETAAATVLNAASTAVTTDIVIEGEMEINAAGTIIPQVTFSAGPTGTCEVALDSFFEIWVTGPNAVNYVGDWS